jgi:hypothetical protein
MAMKNHVRLAKQLVALMDTKFDFFGIKFGIDPFLDFWPGFGDLLGAGIACYLFWIAYEAKVPRWVYWRMAWHIGIDYILGALPVVGFVFDLFYRANAKNLALLSEFIDPEILEGTVIGP